MLTFRPFVFCPFRQLHDHLTDCLSSKIAFKMDQSNIKATRGQNVSRAHLQVRSKPIPAKSWRYNNPKKGKLSTAAWMLRPVHFPVPTIPYFSH